MGLAKYHTEIMHIHPGIDVLQNGLNQYLQRLHTFVLRVHRIHMNTDNRMIFCHQFLFNTVNAIMAAQQIFPAGHFGVERNNAAAGAIVMDHQVMHSHHSVVSHHGFPDRAHQFRRRCLTQQR